MADTIAAASRPPMRSVDDARADQHPLWLSVALHLLPGAVLTAFIVLVAGALAVEPLLALLVGIIVVLAPLELGYLAWDAKRTTGSWSPLRAVDYRAELPGKTLALLGIGLASWMILLVVVAIATLDQWLSTRLFGWLPPEILSMAAVEAGDEVLSTGALIAFLALFFVANGIVGPITEELYFRGHLLPRMQRLGRGAPILNTALFTLYHFHTPWRYPVIFLGYLPIAWESWRRRSFVVGLVAHMIINNVFVLLVLAAYLSGT
jgi:membrane protease YdiL (CAAX protease family)